MKNYRLLALPIALSLGVGGLSACTSLPRNTDAQVLRTFVAPSPEETAIGPEPGREADLLLRDFYTAAAIPTQNFQAARAFLTPETSKGWDPRESTLVVDRIDLNTQPGSTAEKRTFAVRGTVIGRLASGGAYHPENGVYEATVEMRMVDGQWRISSLPAGVVLERTELRNQYQPHEVYFFDSSDEVLVSDRRWVFAGRSTLDTVLISLMMEGPSTVLAPAVDNELPPEARFVGLEDGVYQFTGLGGLSEAERTRFAARLVWTLAMANVPGPYQVLGDGAPLLDNTPKLTTDDVAEFNPKASSVSTLYALTDGSVQQISGGGAEPVTGDAGHVGNITSVDIASPDKIAAVQRRADGSSALMGGTLDGELTEILSGKSITRPSFEHEPSAVWAVVDAKKIVRVVRSATGGYAITEVDSSGLEDIDGDISVFRLSRTGVRAAMIIDGRVFTAVISRPEAGERKITNVQEVAPHISGQALSLDWQPDGSILVGTSAAETPIWRVEQDGSALSSLPSGNISAPVVAVAASSQTIYLTDGRAVLQLSAAGGDSSFWREVPGLQGVRSAPVVSH